MAEDLTPTEIAAYQVQLHALIKALKVAIDEKADFVKPVDLDAPIGRVSRIDAIAVQQMAKENRLRQKDRLRAAEAALTRIAQADYGYCVVCDEPIARARLSTRPESAACVRCQTISEAGNRR